MNLVLLRTEATDYWKLCCEAQDGSMNAQRTLDALDKTLNYFGVMKDRQIAANNLLKLSKLSRLQRNCWDARDKRVQAIIKMVEYFFGC